MFPGHRDPRPRKRDKRWLILTVCLDALPPFFSCLDFTKAVCPSLMALELQLVAHQNSFLLLYDLTGLET